MPVCWVAPRPLGKWITQRLSDKAIVFFVVSENRCVLSDSAPTPEPPQRQQHGRVTSALFRGDATASKSAGAGTRVSRGTRSEVRWTLLLSLRNPRGSFSGLAATGAARRGAAGRDCAPARDVSKQHASLGHHLGVRGRHAPPVGRASPARAERRTPVADARPAFNRRPGKARRLRERGFLERRRFLVAERGRRPVRLRVVAWHGVSLSRVRVHGAHAQHLLRGVCAEQRVQSLRHRRRRRRRASRGPGAGLRRRRRRPLPPYTRLARRTGVSNIAERGFVVRPRRPRRRHRPSGGRGHGHETSVRARVGGRVLDDAPGRPRAPLRPAASDRKPRDALRPEHTGQLLRHRVRPHKHEPFRGRVRRPVRARV